ncbi:hypothetical protein [Dyella sp. EPa41]|uniref:hypothetical protein n=1 Tax=Dyella sp. EPa41 TaxID=1561194 RepID=UPI001916C380|nr:hypothetical protein [Dyella sp. EPa41]
MSSEDRLRTLEALLVEHGMSSMAMELVVSALIATHPNKAALGQAIGQLFADREIRIRDIGSLDGKTEAAASKTADVFRARAEHWLHLVRKSSLN